MRKTILLLAAALLILAAGLPGIAFPVAGDAPQYRRPDTPERRPNYPPGSDRRTFVGQLTDELVRQAEYFAEASFQYFQGWNGQINEREQAILFKSEEFTAACRLLNRLVQDRTDYFRREMVRTNLYSATRYVNQSFRQLEDQMRLGGLPNDFNRQRRDGRQFQWQPQRDTTGGRGFAGSPWGLGEIRRILGRIEIEFTNWR
jgi:hypothetical protein